MENDNDNVSTVAQLILAILGGIIVMALQIGFSVACITIGVIYDCDKDESTFLIVCGALGIGIITFRSLHKLINSEDDGNGFMANLLSIVQVCVCIWGMTLVWPFHLNPCNDVLYGFAFAAANIWWIVLSIMLICIIIMIYTSAICTDTVEA